MKRKTVHIWTLCLVICLAAAMISPAVAQSIRTNKDRCLTLAVTGEIAPAEPSRGYSTTWNGKPKMGIGIGGINYNLKLGGSVFGWANGERATMGVATVGVGDRQRGTWLIYASIGNQVQIKSGSARGETGVVIGKFGGYALIHFDGDVMEKLTIGDKLQAKTVGRWPEDRGIR